MKDVLQTVVCGNLLPDTAFLLQVDFFSPVNVAGYVVTAIAAILNLLITYVIIRHFVYKPMRKIAKQRETDIMNNLKASEAEVADAVAMKKEAEQTIRNAKSQAAEIITQARRQGEQKKELIVKEAKQQAEAYLAEIEAKQALKAEAEKREQRDQAISLTLKVIQQLNEEAKVGKDQNQLINQVVSALNPETGK